MNSEDKLNVLHSCCFTVFVLLSMILIATNCEQERKHDRGLSAKQVNKNLEEIKRIMISDHEVIKKLLNKNNDLIQQEKCCFSPRKVK